MIDDTDIIHRHQNAQCFNHSRNEEETIATSSLIEMNRGRELIDTVKRETVSVENAEETAKQAELKEENYEIILYSHSKHTM